MGLYKDALKHLSEEKKRGLIDEIYSFSNDVLHLDAIKLIDRLCSVMGFELDETDKLRFEQARFFRKKWGTMEIYSSREKDEICSLRSAGKLK